jgi:two-component system, LytTR family, response regulator
MMRVFVLDDEALAVRRLERMLQETGRVQVVGSATDTQEALAQMTGQSVDLLFLDIEMPEQSGFAFLASLDPRPLVVFVTAYHQYALEAFEASATDYLLKPVEQAKLERALQKAELMLGSKAPRPDPLQMLEALAAKLQQKTAPVWPARIATRMGDKTELIDLSRVLYFLAEDKLTFAVLEGRRVVVDNTIKELEEKLNPAEFFRVHRSALVRLDQVNDLFAWFGGKTVVRLKDSAKTEITVARERTQKLREQLGVL